MGCILSEVVTWVIEGRRKLRDYRRRRAEEVGIKFTKKEDRFHCNGELLETVRELHADLLRNKREHDYITPLIVQRLVHSSVVVDDQSRATAHALFNQSIRIYEEAQKMLDLERSSGPAPHPYHTVSSDRVLGKKKRLPPNFPPKSASTSSIGTFEIEMDGSDLGQSLGHRMWSNGLQERGTHSGLVQNGTAPEPVHEFIGLNGNRKYTIPLERSQVQHHKLDFSHRRPKPVSSQPIFSSMQRHQYTRSSAITAQMEESSQQKPFGSIADDYGNTQASYLPSRSGQNRHSAISAGGSAPRHSTTEAMSHLLDIRDSDPFVERGVPSSDREEEFSSRYRPAHNNRPHPQMSVQKGLEIKRAREHGQNASYPGQDLVRTMDAVLKRRDHVCRSFSLPLDL